jgi:hypothetical protein
MTLRKKRMAEKHELKMAKKDYRLSKKTDGHQAGRQEIIKALVDGLSRCNFGSLKIHIPSTLA